MVSIKHRPHNSPSSSFLINVYCEKSRNWQHRPNTRHVVSYLRSRGVGMGVGVSLYSKKNRICLSFHRSPFQTVRLILFQFPQIHVFFWLQGKQPVASPPEKIYPSKATQSQTTPAPKQNLDHMLGNLQADMSRQGVNTSQKGCCSACDKPIVGQVITALGKTWHPEHFTCNHCSQELGTRNFFEREGKPYCEIDYHNLFSPRCAYCNGPILDVGPRTSFRDENN